MIFSDTYNRSLKVALIVDRKPHLRDFQLCQGDEIRQYEARHPHTQVCPDDVVELRLEASKRLMRYRVIYHGSQNPYEIYVFAVPCDVCSRDVLVVEVGVSPSCAKRSFHGSQQTAVVV